MITRVVYNNKIFKIINNYGYKFSNNEVTFNDIVIDFTDCSIIDIPYKYQEVKIMQSDNEENIFNGTVLFTGFLDEANFSTMKLECEHRELRLTLLSPLKMATRRNVTLYGTYQIEDAIRQILQPLIDDGFTIVEMNVGNGQLTTSFVLRTIEDCMNAISTRRNIFWTINERKEIFVNSLEYLFGLSPARIINGKEEGLLKIQPKITGVEYANIINFKNLRLIYSQFDSEGMIQEGYPIIEVGKKIKTGDIVDFINPVIVDEGYLRAFMKEIDLVNNPRVRFTSLEIGIRDDDYSDSQVYSIEIDRTDASENYDEFIIDENITFNQDGGEEGLIVLQRDQFFPNLITGFKWNGQDGVIFTISSDTALRYTSMRFMHTGEIEKCKGIISDTGQVEKSINLQEKWFFLNDLTDYARSLIIQNSNIVNQVTLEYDIETGLKVGDIVQIDRPEFFVQGSFAISEISYSYISEMQQKWIFTLKNADMFTTYIDLFRKQEQEENQETVDTVILSEFIEEKISEVHENKLNADHTLNFIINL